MNLNIPNILEAALGDPKFSKICEMCCQAGIDHTLKVGGPYTFFAPTNDAFNHLDKGVLENLLLPENKEELVTMLTYHIIASKLSSSALKVGKIRTLSGKRCELGRRHGQICIDEALVTHSDLECTNGFIHVINRVILPNLTI